MEDALFTQGIEYFNAGYFFEAHDAFEELWIDHREADKLFYQGLVQLATGFYHLMMKNAKGAESQLSKGLQKLRDYRPTHAEIDVSGLLAGVEICLELVRQLPGNGANFSEIYERIPKLKRIAVED
ncbi:MAG: DUF309 domain-containing protein [Calditrichaeota bacterium]|nr:MAG: DUF309 domain-containing protein [Calditrichota bacterium]